MRNSISKTIFISIIILIMQFLLMSSSVYASEVSSTTEDNSTTEESNTTEDNSTTEESNTTEDNSTIEERNTTEDYNLSDGTLLDNECATAYIFEDEKVLVVTAFKYGEKGYIYNQTEYPWIHQNNWDPDKRIYNDLDGYKVIIKDSVVGFKAFEYTGITEITITDSVTKIGEGAFQNCANLTTINIGNGISDLEFNAFWVENETVTTVNTNNEYILSKFDFEEDNNRPAYCEITFYSDGKAIEVQQVTRDEKVVEPEVPDQPDSEFEFKGWYTNSEYTEEWNFDTPVSTNVELVAKWEVKEKEIKTITIDPGNGDDVIVQQVAEGEILILPEEPYREGYCFDGWFVGESVYDIAAPVTEDMTIEAHWSEEEQINSIEDSSIEDNTVEDNTIEEKSIIQKLVETIKRIVLLITISLIPLVALLLFAYYSIRKMKEVSILNNKNTDEYSNDKYELVYNTSVKTEGNIIAELLKQEDRVWTLSIPKNITDKKVTDSFKIVMNKNFCKRYNGEQLIIVVHAKDKEINHGFVIDKEENEIILILDM